MKANTFLAAELMRTETQRFLTHAARLIRNPRKEYARLVHQLHMARVGADIDTPQDTDDRTGEQTGMRMGASLPRGGA